MRKVVLDTNAYTTLLAGEEAVLDELAAADRVLMSAVVKNVRTQSSSRSSCAGPRCSRST